MSVLDAVKAAVRAGSPATLSAAQATGALVISCTGGAVTYGVLQVSTGAFVVAMSPVVAASVALGAGLGVGAGIGL